MRGCEAVADEVVKELPQKTKGAYLSPYSLSPRPLYLSSNPPPPLYPSGSLAPCAPLFTTQKNLDSRAVEGRCETIGIGRSYIVESRSSQYANKKSETRETSARDAPGHAATSYHDVRPRLPRFRPTLVRASIRVHGTFISRDIPVCRYLLGRKRDRKTRYR